MNSHSVPQAPFLGFIQSGQEVTLRPEMGLNTNSWVLDRPWNGCYPSWLGLFSGTNLPITQIFFTVSFFHLEKY